MRWDVGRVLAPAVNDVERSTDVAAASSRTTDEEKKIIRYQFTAYAIPNAQLPVADPYGIPLVIG